MTGEARRDGALWAGILVGPLVWLTSFLTNFALAPWACALRWKPALFAVSACALFISASAGLLAYGQWRQAGFELPGEVGGETGRTRAMALAGVLLSGLSMLIIVAQGVVELILGACD